MMILCYVEKTSYQRKQCHDECILPLLSIEPDYDKFLLLNTTAKT